MASVTVATGTYPTAAPSALSGTAVSIDLSTAAGISSLTGVSFLINVATGTDTFYGLGYLTEAARWVPLATLASDSSVAGGNVFGRVTGLHGRDYSGFLLWRSGGSVTPAAAYIRHF